MSDIPVTQLRRNRKKKSIVIGKKTLMYVIFQISIFSIILLLPVLSRSFVAYTNTLLSLCTLFLFGAIIAYLSIRLFIMLINGLERGKHAAKLASSGKGKGASDKQEESMVIDEPRLQNSWTRSVELILSISAWAFFLYLLQPFITAVLWWQGYKLVEGQAFPLDTIQGTLTMIESSVYFGIVVFLILFSWSRWNYWRYGRLNRRRPKPLVSNTDLAVFYDVSLAAVETAQSSKMAHVVVESEGIKFEKLEI